MKIVYLIISFMILLLNSGCGGLRQVNADAKNVNLYFSYPTGNCRFLGIIKNPNVHEVMDIRSSLKDLEKDDNIFLKNEGAKLGANVIVLVTHTPREAHKRYVRGSKNLTTINIHSVIANAYYCPHVKVDQLQQRNLEIKQTPLFENDDLQINH
ncbi:TPA: DUF4156 domain-containing protein [Legionella pneumophila]|uniref:DUF4156 domain-containing protein n=1 Tax=Legionella pneumophila TaxID=446 RepID=UPI0028651A68|nr:DUF4156 domain-containing protein [Legionella pneumophila]MDW8909458.1 DUF4156 domain-containing protein [Legionella pneumophila]HBC0494945.1 DUF4156 domain-containing protein [Legionella pneumophila]HCR5123793.1 DUF4156 domain-containing protein [Legionella pneumophila]HCR5126564.1 DUF4156 domain-containing protein [Legionella pneumophila]